MAKKQLSKEEIAFYRDKFEKYTDRAPQDRRPELGDCWLGRHPGHENSYGSTKTSLGIINNHRISYMVFKGHIPKGMVIDHLCNVRRCCNPNHLRIATPQENSTNRLPIQRKWCKTWKHPYEEGKGQCRECLKEYRQANAGKKKERDKEYYRANVDKIKDAQKYYQQTNADKIKKRKKKYRQVNQDKIKEYRQAIREKMKEYFRANRDRINERRRERRALKKAG